jgi:hypothetical protein
MSSIKGKKGRKYEEEHSHTCCTNQLFSCFLDHSNDFFIAVIGPTFSKIIIGTTKKVTIAHAAPRRLVAIPPTFRTILTFTPKDKTNRG